MTASELVNQGYRKYIGWGDAEANADFNAVHPAKDPPAPTPGTSADDIVANAQKLNEFYKTQNAPIVSTLQGQQGTLKSTYDKLVADIKGYGQTQENQQTLATNNELGRRGILSTSGLYQQDLANALAPVRQNTTSQLTQAETGYNKDANDLALQIANAQAGNPSAALTSSSSLANLAAQIASQQYQSPLQQAQASYYNALASGKIGAATNDPLGLAG